MRETYILGSMAERPRSTDFAPRATVYAMGAVPYRTTHGTALVNGMPCDCNALGAIAPPTHNTGGGGGGSSVPPIPPPDTGTGGDTTVDVGQLGQQFLGILGDVLGTPGRCGLVDYTKNGALWCGMSQEIADWVHYYAPEDFFKWIKTAYPTSAANIIDGWKLRLATLPQAMQHLYAWAANVGWPVPVELYRYKRTTNPKDPGYYIQGVTEESYAALGIDFWPTMFDSTYFGGSKNRVFTIPIGSGLHWTTEAAARAGHTQPPPPVDPTTDRNRPRVKPPVPPGPAPTSSGDSIGTLAIAAIAAKLLFT